MEKWNGVTIQQMVIDPISELIEDGASTDELLEEVEDFNERGVLPDSAINWVLNRIG